jgi:small subunit ribosomal protein S1
MSEELVRNEQEQRMETSAKSEVKVQQEDFDWEAYEKETHEASDEEKSKLEELYKASLKQIAEKEVIEGTVIAISDREVFVNIGYKSDGVIPINEVRYNPNLKVGDKLDVYVDVQEDGTGQLVLSHKKARLLKAWNKINEIYEKGEIVQGEVVSRTKGGLIVDVFGIECFMPGSQIDVKPIRDYDQFVGKIMDVKVVKVNHEYKNVVVSHKAIIEDELEAQKAEIIAKLEKGQILEGTVKNITSYGVFVDLGGVDGLIHITDLSWGRVTNPEDIVKLDQKINVVILDFDESKKRISLGLKQLTPHPWDSLDPNLKVGDKVRGKVVMLADYGAFIEITPGVEGLIHVTEMSWSQHLRSAQEFLKLGDEVEAIILTLDREERKMSLSIKRLMPDPWVNIHEKYPIGSRHKAIVRNYTNFGVFVELEEGVHGLIHVSDLSWTKKIKHPAEFVKIGDEIEVVILEIDVENRRLSLGHKQLEENPWDFFETVFTIGSVHKGVVVEKNDKNALISLPYGIEGTCPLRQLVKQDGSVAEVDETLDFKVVEFSKELQKIVVSHTKVYQEPKEPKKAKKEEKPAKESKKSLPEKETLGDLEVFAKLKDKKNNK